MSSSLHQINILGYHYSELDARPYGESEDRRLGTYALGHKVPELKSWLIHNLNENSSRKDLHYVFAKIKSVSPDFVESLKVMAEVGVLKYMVDREEMSYGLLGPKVFESVWLKIAHSIPVEKWAEVADAGVVGFPSQNALIKTFPITTALAQKFWKFYASRKVPFAEIHDNVGDTLLQASANALVEIDKLRQGVKWFFNMGGVLSSQNKEGNNIWHTLVKTKLGHVVGADITENAAEAISFLATQTDVNVRNLRGNTPLLFAVSHGSHSFCSFLIKNTKAKIMVTNNQGENALSLIENLNTASATLRSQANSWSGLEDAKKRMRALIMETNELQLREAAFVEPARSPLVRKI